jgi:glutamate/tyrosine decarboxylase-like PLP-dependent enzyme
MSLLIRVFPAILLNALADIVHAAEVSGGVHYGASEAYVMALVGLGLLGFVVNRRK